MPTVPIKPQAFLSNLPLFRELAPEEIERIAKDAREIRAKRGDVLFRKGDPCRGFHTIVYGQVKLVFITPQGDEKVVEIMGAGQSFGEALMFMEKPYIVTAETLAVSLITSAPATVDASTVRVTVNVSLAPAAKSPTVQV